MESRKYILRDYAFSFVGTWYSWGGDDPDGFDCSGFVVEMLKSVGILERHMDRSAQGLHDMFLDCKVDKPHFGCLALYWNTGGTKVVHVEMFLDSVLTIGASGGYSKTKTKEDAKLHNAFIKIRPVNTGRGDVTIVDPFKKV